MTSDEWYCVTYVAYIHIANNILVIGVAHPIKSVEAALDHSGKVTANSRAAIIHGLTAFLVLQTYILFLIPAGRGCYVISSSGMLFQHLLFKAASPILSLIYQLHYKILTYVGVKIIFSLQDKQKPLMTSFQGGFKDEYRFYSGVYFLYRFFPPV